MEDWQRYFEWDSEDQKKGYEGFLFWANRHRAPKDVTPFDMFVIQKSHEAGLQFIDVLNEQVKMLQSDIMALRKEIETLRGNK